jgi:hypothetical protein
MTTTPSPEVTKFSPVDTSTSTPGVVTKNSSVEQVLM